MRGNGSVCNGSAPPSPLGHTGSPLGSASAEAPAGVISSSSSFASASSDSSGH
ncbi:hypothetical protein ACWD4V_10380 [Streptomyces tsukubensis]